MKSVKVFSGLLVLGLLAQMSPIAVNANNENMDITANAVISVMEENVFKQGKITEKNENQLTIKVEGEENSSVILNLSDRTVIIDSMSGEAFDLDKLQVGDKIAAYVSPTSTRSLPPIMNAYAILANISNEIMPKMHKVGKILESKEGELKALDAIGSVQMTFNSNTEILTYKTKNIVGLDDIKEGAQIIAWYSVITLSLPGQTTVEKVLLLPIEENQEGWVNLGEGNWNYNENGKQVSKWVAAGSDWYNVKNGIMVRNSWIAKDNTGAEWYYVDNEGKMVSNKSIDGYVLNSQGVYTK